jgi:hypothetical protein
MFSAIGSVIQVIRGQKTFGQALPEVFDSIDDQLPALIGYATGYEVEELIGRSITKATGKKATKRQVRKVISLYDPTIAAIKAFRSMK